MKGIIEITENTKETLNLMELISRHNTKNNRHKMGLGLEEVYGADSGLLPKHLNDITKYNKHLEWKYGMLDNGITLNISHIIDTIYKAGNIQSNDKVLILLNQCRGIDTYENVDEWNTIKKLSSSKKNVAYKMRVNSQEKGYATIVN